jgi:hypothetical protein
MFITANHYNSLDTIELPGNEDIDLTDHLGGFDENLKNPILDMLVNKQCPNKINLQYCIDPILKNQYKTIDINFSSRLHNSIIFRHHNKYNKHPDINYKNFICSFNGTAHISRKLLVSILKRFNWFSSTYSSKNFSYSTNIIDGHISDFVRDNELFYRKFFISNTSEEFFQTKYSFGHKRFDHGNNIYTLENKLTESFIHIVSETIATSYYPYVTEKFLYSIVTRGLFLAYAHPGWHSHLEKYYGFKRYTKLFNYHFDTIQNPIERLVELMTMLSKFSYLTPAEWQDLYHIEQDTIEYNYDHYFSGNYLADLRNYENKL